MCKCIPITVLKRNHFGKLHNCLKDTLTPVALFISACSKNEIKFFSYLLLSLSSQVQIKFHTRANNLLHGAHYISHREFQCSLADCLV